ncbi:hypothetical protein BDY19DRAFT_988110 [Irpex rosettiformis]|uniref:Uncharacterized protein n=1 Tax=Irpex rosettiformis TaxID=378272 RepID=A0ACB8UJG0_9APHY|nr:hypothetical protein BDY19DRAFT_988110 [Irpex rosettiformis]
MPTLDGKACSILRCLKTLAICIANTIMASGWLMMSVLSVLSDWTHLFDAPPTFPKLPARRTVTDETGFSAAREGEIKGFPPSPKPTLPHAVFERIQVERANSLEQRVQAQSDQSAQVQTVQSALPSPSTVGSLPTPPESSTVGPLALSPNGSSSGLPLSSPAKESKHSARGRRLVLFRMSSERSQSSEPSICSSERSERSNHGVKPCLRRVASGLDFAHHHHHHHHKHSRTRPRSPVRRTDPYQAPYFFPTPLSPDAAGYVQRVKMERGSSGSPEDHTVPLPAIVDSPSAVLRQRFVEEARQSPEGNRSSPRTSSSEGQQTAKSASTKHSRGRPVSWTGAASLRSPKSDSSFQRSTSASTSSPVKKFWRKAIRHGSAPTDPSPTYGNDDLHHDPHALPSPSFIHELKRRRTWFGRRHSVSLADLPSPSSLAISEFGELPQRVPQQH